jgi:glycosyltransferase involved in cell wall biosynthesis
MDLKAIKKSSRDSIKTLFLITQIEPAGAQKVLLLLSSGLQNIKDFNITVCTMYDKCNYIPMMEKSYGIPIINLKMKNPNDHRILQNIIRFIKGLIYLSKIIRSNRIQILQTFTHYSDIIGPIICWLNKVPICVTSIHLSLSRMTWLTNTLNKFVQNRSIVKKIIAVSESLKIEGINKFNLNPSKVIFIHNGIDLSAYKNVNKFLDTSIFNELSIKYDTTIISVIARLSQQKGHEFLLKAIPKIINKYSKIKFIFAGDGPLCSQLKSIVNSLELQGYVLFIGNRSDIPRILAASTIFVLPSLAEGFPMSVLEAMAAETPVIATKIDGIPEIIPDERYGLLVPPANSNSLADAICRLISDKNLRINLAKNGKQRVINMFSKDVMVQSYHTLYTTLLKDIISSNCL